MKLFKTNEAAKFLGVSVKTIKRWRKSGNLFQLKLGTTVTAFTLPNNWGHSKANWGHFTKVGTPKLGTQNLQVGTR